MNDSIGTADDVMVTGRDWSRENDEPFIYATWRNGSYYGGDRSRSPSEFFPEKTAQIKEILKHARVRVACIKDAPDVILGYIVITGDLHVEWIFVKQQFRGKRIGTFLIGGGIKTVTPELTRIGTAIVRKKNLIVKGETHGIREESKIEEASRSPKVSG